VAWTKPEFSRGRVNDAGDLLAGTDPSPDQINLALAVLNNWRSSHSFPLNTIQMGLRGKAQSVYASALVVQRLKRTTSIVTKLRRFRGMKLARMQDIGGCRAVVRSVGEVRRVHDTYRRSRSQHKLVREDDYITTPKPSGYRGIHLVYRFGSPYSPDYNGLTIEVQLRSLLQHAWATAVETVGAILGQALKASEGESDWLEFFQLSSSAFALVEASPVVSGTPTVKRTLVRRLARLSRELGVREKLRAYRQALKFTEKGSARRSDYYLLLLEPEARTLNIFGYRREELAQAQEEYLLREKQLPLFSASPEAQAVLVAAESLDALRRSYPNYFLDTQRFLVQLEKVIRSG
jgi:hypothetical protein